MDVVCAALLGYTCYMVTIIVARSVLVVNACPLKALPICPKVVDEIKE